MNLTECIALIFASAIVILVAAVLGPLLEGGLANRSQRIALMTGHDPDDPECKHYRGDYAGIYLEAECKICRGEV